MENKGEEVSREAVIKRLRKIEGQIRGLQKMVADERECETIITQLTAIRAAIDSAGALVLKNFMKICFRKNEMSDQETYNTLARIVAIWGRVRIHE